jgi:hypothetical protein
MVLHDTIQLATQVLARHLHARQDAGDGFLQRGVPHDHSSLGLTLREAHYPPTGYYGKSAN